MPPIPVSTDEPTSEYFIVAEFDWNGGHIGGGRSEEAVISRGARQQERASWPSGFACQSLTPCPCPCSVCERGG